MNLKNCLKELKKQTGETVSSFSERTGVSRSYLYEIMRGEKFPSPEIFTRLEECSNGLITYGDLLQAYKKLKHKNTS